MESETPETTAIVFGPPETTAILAQKWLHKFQIHLDSWPGVGLPWSVTAMPQFCNEGLDLVVTFLPAAKAGGLEETLNRVPKFRDRTYPWTARADCPFWGCEVLRSLICSNVRIWTQTPQARCTGMLRDQISEVVDKVTLAEAEGIWPIDKDVEAKIERLNDNKDAFKAALFPVIVPKIESRLGLNAPLIDRENMRCKILAEMASSGELQKVMAAFEASLD